MAWPLCGPPDDELVGTDCGTCKLLVESQKRLCFERDVTVLKF